MSNLIKDFNNIIRKKAEEEGVKSAANAKALEAIWARDGVSMDDIPDDMFTEELLAENINRMFEDVNIFKGSDNLKKLERGVVPNQFTRSFSLNELEG